VGDDEISGHGVVQRIAADELPASAWRRIRWSATVMRGRARLPSARTTSVWPAIQRSTVTLERACLRARTCRATAPIRNLTPYGRRERLATVTVIRYGPGVRTCLWRTTSRCLCRALP
jgi:hypothetical protein